VIQTGSLHCNSWIHHTLLEVWGNKWWLVKVQQNGVQTSHPVELGQCIMREVADPQQLFQHFRWTFFEHPAYSPDLTIFTSFPHWRIIFLATNLQVTTTWKQLLWDDWNRRAKNSMMHKLTNQHHNWTNASILVGTMFKNKVVNTDNTCYLFCSNGNIQIRIYGF
jgi:hypothetical protein